MVETVAHRHRGEPLQPLLGIADEGHEGRVVVRDADQAGCTMADDDVGFFTLVVGDIEAHACIDPKRVYATFSEAGLLRRFAPRPPPPGTPPAAAC